MKGGLFLLGVSLAALATAAPGDIDHSFKAELKDIYEIWDVREQEDGKVLVAGVGKTKTSPQAAAIIRLHPDGRLDNSFRRPWSKRDDARRVYRIRIRDDGQIGVVGVFKSVRGHYAPNVALLRPNGRVNKGYKPVAEVPQGWQADITPDGRVYFVDVDRFGMISADGKTIDIGRWLPKWWTYGFFRILDDGTPIGSVYDRFNHHTYPSIAGGYSYLNSSGAISDIARETNGSFLIAGELFSRSSGLEGWRWGILRATPFVRVDWSFNFTTPFNIRGVSRVLPDDHGRVIYIGVNRDAEDPMRSPMARVLADGSPDPSFSVGSGANGLLTGLRRIRSGALLVWGAFDAFNGEPVTDLARLHCD